MTLWTLIRRSLAFHSGAHGGVVLGVVIGSAALTGALIIGDSVRGSLKDMALERLAGASVAMNAQDRFFEADLFGRISSGVGKDPRAEIESPSDSGGNSWPGAVLLQLPAVATRQDGMARANRVQLFGVDQRFFGSQPVLGPGEVVLNDTLARQLKAQPGEEILLRVQKPSALSRDAVISPRGNAGVALRFKVRGTGEKFETRNAKLERSWKSEIRTWEERLNLNLHASQAPAANAFVRLDELGQAVDLADRGNLMLIGTPGATEVSRLESALGASWRLGDAETVLDVSSNRQFLELRTRRVFLDPPLARAAMAAETNAQPILTFLGNLIQAGTNSTPYSMIASAGPPYTPADLQDDEIIVNRWLADDLKVAPGDRISVTYFDPESGAKLLEHTNTFRIRMVVPMETPWADRALMPDFPGIEKAESTQDWDAGFPLVYKIRPQDEAYWKQSKGTPKAFITLRAGQKIWANRFGDLTAIRFQVPAEADPAETRAALERRILAAVKPAEIGLRFDSVRADALRGASQSQDFGQLFLGFSFFLIAAAMLLMALLFQFSLEQRATEIGTLLALGFKPARVRWMFLGEGAALACLGGLIGALGGLGYAKLMLWGLATVWREAVGGSVLRLHADPGTLAAGMAISVVLAVLVVWLTLRRQGRQPVRGLLAAETEAPVRMLQGNPRAAGGSRWGRGIALVTGLGAVGIVGFALMKGAMADAEAFFSAGALLLIAGLAGTSAWFGALQGRSSVARLSLAGLGVRGCVRRRKRSLATVALLASGAFLILALGVFRLDANSDAARRSSGTGGFALLGEATLPVLHDLNTPAGREAVGLGADDLAGVSSVPFRVRAGDDASCLNLSRAQAPRLLGVKPGRLADRFTFVGVAKGLDRQAGWRLLERGAPGADEIPAIGDANSIQWALGKKLGDTLDYTDEQGRTFRLRLVGAVANSILQGNLVIDEAEFMRRFPGEAGYRMLLLDVPSNSVSQVSATLTRALEDSGLELTPTAQRLNTFNAVQNTYLGTFQVLGGLGLLLGSAGLGIVVLRNVRERRGELGVLAALGFRRWELHRLVLSEHGALLALGLGLGAGAAAVAVLPALLAPGTPLPYRSLAVTLIGVWLNGLLWTWLATRRALQGNLLEALRGE